MKEKKIALVGFFVMFILVSISVNGDLTTNLTFYHTFDNTELSGTNYTDLIGSYDGKLNSPYTTGQTGKLEESVNITKAGDGYLSFSTDIVFDTTFNLCFANRKTDATGGGYEAFYRFQDTGSGNYMRHLEYGTDNKFSFRIADNSGNNCNYEIANTNYVDDDWHFYCIIRNGTTSNNDCTDEMYLEIDGTRVIWTADTGTDTIGTLTANGLKIFGRDISAGRGSGGFDNLLFYNVDIGKANRDLLYNSGSLCNPVDNPTGCGGGSPSQGTLTINHNLVNTSTSSKTGLYLTYNGTIADTGNIFNCTLYNDTNIVETQLDKDLSTNQSFFIETNNKEENYWFKIYCLQAGEVNDTTTTHFYQIDSVSPSLTFTSNFQNNSNQIKDSILDVSYTFTDYNIYAVNVSWFASDNSLQQNFFIDSLTGSSYSNTTSKLLSDTCTNCSIRFEAWDSHTGEVLKYDLEIFDDYTFKYNNIFITSDKKLKFDKEKDKYMFIVDKKSTICYTTDNYFRKVKSSYNSHYIDFKNEIWIDELQYDFTEYYENGKLNKLCFYNDKDKEYKTESIGDLNYAQYGYNYNVISQDTLYLSEIAENTEDIGEGLKMIYLVLLWTVITIGGILMLLKGWKIGIMVYFTGFILDLLIMGNIYLDFVANASNSGVGFLFSIALTLLIPTWFLTRTWLGLSITNTGGN